MKRLISVLVSLIVLGMIYWRIDLNGLLRVLKDCDGSWMVISLGMVIPLTCITAWRLQQLMPRGNRLGFGEANRLILVASVLNMILPSKMGDIAKAFFMKERGHLSGSLSLSLVLFEKACDMLSLLLWCAFGLILYPEKGLLFWIMTLCVALGLGLGSLLLSSPRFARSFFRFSQKITPEAVGARIKK
ncbi:MAG: flippase-like domain-containing protein, partial [Deltaproteobacteria bacterium]|nr:flippase-like domain-containing protein [Deltaproteobacteria bacterium]